jgi:hypothetical protein
MCLLRRVGRFIKGLAGGFDQQRYRAELIEGKEAGMAALALHCQRRLQLQLIPGIGFRGWCISRLNS